MSTELDSYLSAYEDDFEFAFDNNIILNWYPERIMKLCPSSSRVLELGIGHGYTSYKFSKYFEDYTVVDGSEAVIEHFRKRYPECGANVLHSYFEDFTPDGLFDVLVLGFVLEHVEDSGAILRRYRQFLAPGGRCFVGVPNGESLHRRFGHAGGLLGDMMELGQGDIKLGHRRLYSVKSLTEEMEGSGYSVVRKEGIFLKPLMTSQLQSLRLDARIIRGMCEVGIDYPELSSALLFEATASEN